MLYNSVSPFGNLNHSLILNNAYTVYCVFSVSYYTQLTFYKGKATVIIRLSWRKLFSDEKFLVVLGAVRDVCCAYVIRISM